MDSGAERSQMGGAGAAGAGSRPSPEELRAAYEQQIKQVRVEDLVLENVVTLLNLGMRRAGLSPGTEDEQDASQVRMAIEAVRAMLPLLEQSPPREAPPEYLRQVREALSQLQMAFVRIGGQAAAPAADTPAEQERVADPAEAPEAPQPGQPGPAQRSGRLWVPGQ